MACGTTWGTPPAPLAPRLQPSRAWGNNTHRDALPQLKAILKDMLYP
jgi:hypothetical protein